MDYGIKAALLQKMQEIRREIAELKEQIRKAQTLIRQYTLCQKSIQGNLESWDEQRACYGQIWLALVKRENYFEGYTTDRVEIKLLDTIDNMDKAAQKAGGVLPGIQAQITMLEELIETLEQQIRKLEEELAALQEGL